MGGTGVRRVYVPSLEGRLRGGRGGAACLVDHPIGQHIYECLREISTEIAESVLIPAGRSERGVIEGSLTISLFLSHMGKDWAAVVHDLLHEPADRIRSIGFAFLHRVQNEIMYDLLHGLLSDLVEDVRGNLNVVLFVQNGNQHACGLLPGS